MSNVDTDMPAPADVNTEAGVRLRIANVEAQARTMTDRELLEAVYVKLDLIAMWQKNATDIVTNMTAQFKDHPILSMFGS